MCKGKENLWDRLGPFKFIADIGIVYNILCFNTSSIYIIITDIFDGDNVILYSRQLQCLHIA